jgi:hypothetical protein
MTPDAHGPASGYAWNVWRARRQRVTIGQMSLLPPTAVVAVAVATLVLAALVATATRRHPDEALAGSRSSVLALEVDAGAALAAAGIAIGWQRRAWRPGPLFAVAIDLPGVAVDGARARRPRLRSRGGPLDQLTRGSARCWR